MTNDREKESQGQRDAEKIGARTSIFWQFDNPDGDRVEHFDRRKHANPRTDEIVLGMEANLNTALEMLRRARLAVRDSQSVADRACRNEPLELEAAIRKAVRGQIACDYQRARAEVAHWRQNWAYWQGRYASEIEADKAARAALERMAGTPICRQPLEVDDDELPF